jgi:hypothetical protein
MSQQLLALTLHMTWAVIIIKVIIDAFMYNLWVVVLSLLNSRGVLFKPI